MDPPVTDKVDGVSPEQIDSDDGLIVPPTKGGVTIISIILEYSSHAAEFKVLIACLLKYVVCVSLRH